MNQLVSTIAVPQSTDGNVRLDQALLYADQMYDAYYRGSFELARMVEVNCVEHGHLLANLAERSFQLFRLLPCLFSVALQESLQRQTAKAKSLQETIDTMQHEHKATVAELQDQIETLELKANLAMQSALSHKQREKQERMTSLVKGMRIGTLKAATSAQQAREAAEKTQLATSLSTHEQVIQSLQEELRQAQHEAELGYEKAKDVPALRHEVNSLKHALEDEKMLVESLRSRLLKARAGGLLGSPVHAGGAGQGGGGVGGMEDVKAPATSKVMLRVATELNEEHMPMPAQSPLYDHERERSKLTERVSA